MLEEFDKENYGVAVPKDIIKKKVIEDQKHDDNDEYIANLIKLLKSFKKYENNY